MRMTKIKGSMTMNSSGEESDSEVSVAGAASGGQEMKGTSTAKGPQLKPQMDSIFAEVEKSLPSIDFDLSDISSDTDEPIIFHRSLKTSDYLFDDDKDLDTSLSGESLTDMMQPMKQAIDNIPELPPPYDNDLALLKPMFGEESQTGSGGSWEALVTDYEQDTENSKCPKPQMQNWMALEQDMSQNVAFPPTYTNSGTSMDDDFMDNRLVVEENYEEGGDNSQAGLSIVADTEAADMNQKSKQDNEKQKSRAIASTFVSARPPVLSLQALENIDLDVLLESLNEDNQYGPRTTLTTNNRGGGDTAEHRAPPEDLTLIQKLAQLSVSQGGCHLSSIDPRTGAIREEDNRKTAEKEIKKTTSCMGTNTSDLSRMFPPSLNPAPAQPKVEPDTVFIDLRHFEENRQKEQNNIERVQQILGIQHDGSDSSDSDDDMEQWQTQRRQIKDTLMSRGLTTQPLPSKPKPFQNRNIKQPNRVINLSERGTNVQKMTDSQDEDKQKAVDDEQKKAPHAASAEKERQMEAARKLREQREKERESRVRMGKRIEAVRPTASVSGRYPSAENTPVIFDIDASYEPPPKTLPGVISPDQECVLLTVNLSSNGEIVLHRNRTNKSVDTGCGLSASYTTLLTWLLSLVPDDFTFLQGAAQPKDNAMFFGPFHVVGLQQMWMDEQLCLAIAVSPAKEFDAKFVPVKSKKSKVRDEVKGSSPFMQHVSKFLSTNTLHTVCPWLQAFVSMDVTCANKDDPELCASYTYQPPLPNVTTKPLSTYIHLNPDQRAACKVFNTPVGFFWQTVDSDDGHFEVTLHDTDVNYETQNTMSLIYKKIFREPGALMGILNRVLQEGLDLSGVRLLYPTAELLNSKECVNSEKQSDLDLLNNIGPVLAIALRGTFARSIWLDAVGPSDPALARRTDPMSLCAQFGGASRDECLLFCPRNQGRVHSELTRWFGGRVPSGGVIEVGTPYTRKEHLRSGSPKGRKGKRGSAEPKEAKEDRDELLAHRPPATLTATHKSDIFLILSPLVPLRSYGLIMSTCQRRGYQIHGLRRLRLTSKRASALGISSAEAHVFCPGTNSSDDVADTNQGRQLEATAPSTVLVLQKDNSSHNAASLIEAFMIQMTLQGVLGHVQKEMAFKLTSRHLFHAATFTDGLLNLLGGDFSKCPEYELQCSPSYLQPSMYTNPELEQVAVLLLCGHDILKSCGLLMGKILNLVPHSKTPVVSPLSTGFELLGLKWLPSLSLSQAREVTPFEVGDKQWRESIHTLTLEPVLVLAVRGVNAFKILTSLFPDRNATAGHSPRGQKLSLDKMMSQTADEAYTYIRLFFSRHDLYPDPKCRPLLPYLPESRLHDSSAHADWKKFRPSHPPQVQENIFDFMLAGPQLLTTFLLIKPSAVVKHLARLFKKIAQEGFQIVGLKMAVLSIQQAQHVLSTEVLQDLALCKSHVDHLTSSPSLYVCLRRENAVKRLVDILGPEDPQSARRQSQFLWRGTFGSDTVANGLYGSHDYYRAMLDLAFFFPEGLCCEETPELVNHGIVCPAEDLSIDLHHFDSRDVNLVHHSQALESYSTDMAEIHEMLLQTMCLVLTSPVLTGRGRDQLGVGHVELLDALLTHGFELSAARMLWFTRAQAEHFLHLVDAGSFRQVPSLTSGPTLVLALQRDNAVFAFDSALGGTLSSESILRKFGDYIHRPSSIKQSHQLLTFFFDHLMPGSQLDIVHLKPTSHHS
ncbi:dynein axonemal assembly factor 8-like [Haliotis rubra]|uniref:dynein axonemal assembly factor 8-like n=1 Tax=Haliotis rubra TaxID=36100 RepID=UPI001EE5D2DA|nr:dynein axonemal assembly factor 8-like [Haliotis rubra]